MVKSKTFINLTLRYILFFFGVALLSLGISLIIRAEMGTSSISSLPYVASLGFSPSIGFFTILMNLVFVAIQVWLLRDKFPRVQYLQIPVGFVFGFVIDFWMATLPIIEIPNYFFRSLLLFTGIIFMAIGIFIEVRANVLLLPGDAVVLAINLVTKRNFGTVKIAFDVTLAIATVALSLILFQKVEGVREGTVASAICTGFFVRIITALYNRRTNKQ